MSEKPPILFVKTGCPWCAEAVALLDRRQIGYRSVNVSADRAAFAEMVRLSGQDKAPVLDWHGEILADFGAAELAPFLDSRKG